VRTARILIAFLALISTAFAAELKLRVVDTTDAAISGARIALLDASDRVVASATSAGDGAATLNAANGTYTLQVLAPGFASSQTKVQLPSEAVTLSLKVATATENVVVTATATPIAASDAGVANYSLNGPQLETLNEHATSDVLRFTPGAYVSNSGRMGGLSSLMVRGGETRYNKVIVDGVPVTVNDAGGNFNFGVVPMEQVSRLELQRGANSTLYGSDAMTSVVQMWSTPGTTRAPLLKFGADGGTFGTAHGYGSLSGAMNRFDYNAFADQLNTEGQGVNDTYSNSLQGANVGVSLASKVSLRTRLRHWNSRTGVPGAWDFSTGTVPPDFDQYARENNVIASSELSVRFSANVQSTFSGFEYRHIRRNVNPEGNPARPQDEFFDSKGRFNTAGFETQTVYTPVAWSQSVFGYRFENETGWLGTDSLSFGFPFNTKSPSGLRRNHAVFGEEIVNRNRFSVVAGLRFEHNESFGNKAVPRAALTYLASRGRGLLGATRLRAAYAEGIKAPTFEQSFGQTGSAITRPNPDLKPEQVRSLEGGFIQDFSGGKYSLAATYFNNRYTNLINWVTVDFATFESQFQNLNKSMAHGAEIEINGRLAERLTATASYTYTASQALIAPPCNYSGCTGPGQELFRRPKHLGQALVTYLAPRWGASVVGSFVGRRRDSDFLNFPGFPGPIPALSSVAGYARVDVSGWRTINRYVTAYASVNNALNNHYQEVAGYPALKANFRAGLRFRIGGE
jgi:outer membrane cobalamin receptor